MALLQDSESQIKRKEELARTRKGRPVQVARMTMLVIIVLVGALLITAIIVSIPKANITGNQPLGSQGNITDRLADRVENELRSVLPKTLAQFRDQVAENDFGLLLLPDIITTKSEAAVTYDLYVVRKNFTNEVALSFDFLPEGFEMTASPEILTSDQEHATLQITVPSDANAGGIRFQVTGTASDKAQTTSAELFVSSLSGQNFQLSDLRPMDQGSNWQATITWETDLPANSWVEYATNDGYIENTQKYSFTSTGDQLITEHNIILYYLTPDTIYHYRVKSVDEANNIVVSSDQAFITAIDIPSEEQNTNTIPTE